MVVKVWITLNNISVFIYVNCSSGLIQESFVVYKRYSNVSSSKSSGCSKNPTSKVVSRGSCIREIMRQKFHKYLVFQRYLMDIEVRIFNCMYCV